MAAICVRTGKLIVDVQQKFQKQEDVNRFIARICSETPSRKKVAILWDNASSHRALTVRDYLASVDVAAIFNLPYHPQYNGIEHVFSDIKRRFRKRLTELKIAEVNDLNLEDLVKETFAETNRRVAINQCMHGWRELLAADPRCPLRFQGQALKKLE